MSDEPEVRGLQARGTSPCDSESILKVFVQGIQQAVREPLYQNTNKNPSETRTNIRVKKGSGCRGGHTYPEEEEDCDDAQGPQTLAERELGRHGDIRVGSLERGPLCSNVFEETHFLCLLVSSCFFLFFLSLFSVVLDQASHPPGGVG